MNNTEQSSNNYDYPEISVIMGIYNCADTLQEALDSLYSQTIQNFEIILCDDGSSDNTYMLALANSQIHSNIILLRNEKNQGLNATLNRCLNVARGKFIARMDADDFSMPSRFEKEYNFLVSHPEYAIVSTPMVYFDDKGEFGRGKINEGEPRKEVFNYGAPFCHAPCMVRKEAYDAVNGYTEEVRLLRVEDYNLWMKMYAKGYRGYNLGEHLYAMRDDREAYHRRTLRARLNGIYAHYLAFRELHLSMIGLARYSVMNIVKGIMPESIYNYFRSKSMNR